MNNGTVTPTGGYKQQWSDPDTWVRLFRVIRDNGFVFPCSGILMGAFAEREMGFTIETYQDLERAWEAAASHFLHRGKFSQRKCERRLSEYIFKNRDNQEYWRVARRVARRLARQPLSDHILQTIESAIRAIEDRNDPKLLQDFVHAINYCGTIKPGFKEQRRRNVSS